MKKQAEESSNSSDTNDSEHESTSESSENEEEVQGKKGQGEEDNSEEIPKKFDLSQIQNRMEDGPPSSSDDESDLDDDPQMESEEDKEQEGLSKEILYFFQNSNTLIFIFTFFLDGEDDTEEGKLSGWADAMAKVLNTGKNTQSDKPMLLSKAKKDKDIENLQLNNTSEEKPKLKEKPSVLRAKKQELENVARKKPDIVKDRSKEKKLAKIATRGVVQLFNAVRDQQKSLKTQLDKAGLSITKRDKVYKNLDKDAFLEVLSGKKRSSNAIGGNRENSTLNKKLKTEVKAQSHEDDDGTWSVLKDNFMMGAKMKDWDKESDNEQDE